MGYTLSPLRYPGGKARFSRLLARYVELNDLLDGTYVEPFAGGAGAALSLLFSEHVSRIVLNDADRCIYLFWASILKEPERFLRLVNDTPISISEWKRQRHILKNQASFSDMEMGFAAFYLNRCNRSGILYAGPIGGQEQAGEWSLDVRFNRSALAKKIERVALYGSRISVHNLDAIVFIKRVVHALATSTNKLLVYLDPPYYSKGDQLYLNYYSEQDHRTLAKFIKRQSSFRWIVSYDDVPEIRNLYSPQETDTVSLNYFAYSVRVGREVIIYSPGSVMPEIADVVNRPNLWKKHPTVTFHPQTRPPATGVLR